MNTAWNGEGEESTKCRKADAKLDGFDMILEENAPFRLVKINFEVAQRLNFSEQEPYKMSISSDEVNYLIYRYLVESGFSHSSFCFGYETAIHHVELKTRVNQGTLISLLQKGLLYTQVEAHLLPVRLAL